MSNQVAILDLAPIVEHLRASVAELRLVGAAADFGRATAEALVFPSAFVVALAETPGQNRYQSHALLDQRVIARFGVIWAARDIADRSGRVALDSIRNIRTLGIEAIARFVPEGAEAACEPVGGRLQSGIDQHGGMLWQDDFAVPMTRRILI